MDALAARLEVNLSLNDGSSANDSVLEENDADCSCTSSNQSSTDGESDFPSRLDKDSGVDCSVLTQDSFVSPDKELMERIIKQVEFYFSDENLKKDNFLLKHVCRTKEGNVSLKLVSSFRKVKSIAKDWRVVAYSLRHSDRLVVNEEGTKIRRREPLPEGCRPAHKVNKTVMAFNLPFDKPSMENVAELFARCGDIALIHILRPGTAVPPDIKRSMLAANYPDIGSTACAIIEFEAQESAIKAVDEMDSKDSDWRALHVLPLIFSSRNSSSKEETDEFKQRKTSRKGKKQDRALRTNDSSDSIPSIHDGEWSPQMRKRANTCYPSSFSTVERRTGPPSPALKTTSPIPSRSKEWMRPKSNSWGSWARTGPRRLQGPRGVSRQPRGPDGSPGFSPAYQLLRGHAPQT